MVCSFLLSSPVPSCGISCSLPQFTLNYKETPVTLVSCIQAYQAGFFRSRQFASTQTLSRCKLYRALVCLGTISWHLIIHMDDFSLHQDPGLHLGSILLILTHQSRTWSQTAEGWRWCPCSKLEKHKLMSHMSMALSLFQCPISPGFTFVLINPVTVLKTKPSCQEGDVPPSPLAVPLSPPRSWIFHHIFLAVSLKP